MDNKAPSNRLYLAYGLPALSLALFSMTFFVYGPKFYSDVARLDLALVGLIVLLSRFWDALTDPVIGFLSDKTQSRWGRRRPWILAASIPLALTFVGLFNPKYSGNLISTNTWFISLTFVFFLFWTMVSIPHESLGAELSDDYDERNSIFGIREGFTILGTLLAAVLPTLLAGTSDNLQVFPYLSQYYALLLVITCGLSVYLVSERRIAKRSLPSAAPFASYATLLRNRPFRILLSSYTIGALAGALPATLILYYVEYVLGASFEQANLLLIEYFVAALLALPLWMKIAKRLGKKEAWILSMLINTLAFVGVFFLGQGDLYAYGVLVAISGLGYGATLALPPSMQADVIDYEESKTGARKEGQFFGCWSIAKKAASGVGAGAALWLLGLSGYRPGEIQSESVIDTLRILYALVPSIANMCAIAVACTYPLNKSRHEQIKEDINRHGGSNE